MSNIPVWLLIVAALTLLSLVATWIWVGLTPPGRFARGYIEYRFRERGLPATEGQRALFDELATYALSGARLMKLSDMGRKSLKGLIHDEAEMILHVAEQWFSRNEMMIEAEGLRPIVELLDRHRYPRRSL